MNRNDIRVYYKDARNMDEIDNESVHLVVTSPPYNLSFDYGVYKDNLSFDKYLKFVSNVFTVVYGKLVYGGRVAVNIPYVVQFNGKTFTNGRKRDFYLSYYQKIFDDIGYIMRDIIVWVKNNEIKSQKDILGGGRTAWGSWCSPSNPSLRGCAELVLLFSKGSHKLDGNSNLVDITPEEFLHWTKNVWYIPSASSKSHPAIFPGELPRRLIKLFTYRNNIILDPFCGTGTTLWEAYKLGRKAIGYEINPGYKRIIDKKCHLKSRDLEGFF